MISRSGEAGLPCVEKPAGQLLARRHQCAGCNQRARTDDGSVHDGRTVRDDDAVFDRAGMDEGEASDGDVVADARPSSACAM